MNTPIWLEVHVDAFAVERAAPWRKQARWSEGARALDDLARRAEAAGARLSFRVRETFAARDDPGLLRQLVARGHEVGWHAHGKRLRAARDAVVAAGGTAEVATPGLVQGGVSGADVLLREAAGLGARVVTDRIEGPVAAYQGWIARSPVEGVVLMDVSVSPFDWGVLTRRGRKVVPGKLDPARLLARIAARDLLRPPRGAAAFFGATFHDHDILRPEARDALTPLFERLGPRVVPSALAALPFVVPAPAPPARFSGLLRRLRRLRLDIERRGSPGEDHVLRVGGRDLHVRRVGPAHPERVVVLVHGGESGVTQGFAPFGLSEAALAEAGVAAWSFARTEGARPPGSLETVEETRTVLVAALAEGLPVTLLTWSAGLVPALRAANALGDPRVIAIFDGEGPADRYSLVPPGAVDHPLAALDPWEDAAWAGKEAVAQLPAFAGRYVRLQAERDHVHGSMSWHARRLVEAARRGQLNADGQLLPGRLEDNGAAVLELLRA